MRSIFFTVCLLFAFRLSAQGAAETDTVSVDSVPVALNELVVQGRRAWFEGEKAVFVPTRQEKNLAHDPATLMQSMRLPVLRESNGVITDRIGRPITYFINGIRADVTDMEAFYTKDVRRVEYLENPMDPIFGGAQAVINIITVQYAAGGVVQAEAGASIPCYWSAELASKLVYKRMTYGVAAWFSGYSDHSDSSRGEENYNDIFYEGEHYDRITRLTDSHSWSRTRNISAALSARYKSDRVLATHNLTLAANMHPGEGSYSSESWSPDIFNATYTRSDSHRKSFSPQIKGDYLFTFPAKWHLGLTWRYVYLHDTGDSWNRTGDLEPIENSTRENAHVVSLAVFPSFRLSDKWFFRMMLVSHGSHYSTDYTGSANTNIVQKRLDTSAELSAWWRPSSKFRMQVAPGLSAYYSDWGGGSEHYVSPRVSVSAYWRIRDDMSLSASEWYYIGAPPSSQTSDVTIRQSELVWLKGNPDLCRTEEWNTYIGLSWFTNRWLTLSGITSYSKALHSRYSYYTPASEEMGGLIKHTINGEPVDRFHVAVSADVSLFDSKLSARTSPGWSYVKDHGAGATLRYFNTDFDVAYRVRNCRFSLRYESRVKGLDEGGMERMRRGAVYRFKFTYGTGDFYLSFSAENFFSRRRNGWRRYWSPNFSSDMITRERGMKFSLDVSYTFGFGRRVDSSIDIDRGTTISSSVIGSE